MHPPREGDLPREELLAAAGEARQTHFPCDIYFKFTCAHCGERVSFRDANLLYEKGECNKCGKETIVEYGGFMIAMIREAGDEQ